MRAQGKPKPGGGLLVTEAVERIVWRAAAYDTSRSIPSRSQSPSIGVEAPDGDFPRLWPGRFGVIGEQGIGKLFIIHVYGKIIHGKKNKKKGKGNS